jgi:hypothetical protein
MGMRLDGHGSIHIRGRDSRDVKQAEFAAVLDRNVSRQSHRCQRVGVEIDRTKDMPEICHDAKPLA